MIEKHDNFKIKKSLNGSIIEFQISRRAKLKDAISSIQKYMQENNMCSVYNLIYRKALLYITFSTSVEEIENQYQDYLNFMNQK